MPVRSAQDTKFSGADDERWSRARSTGSGSSPQAEKGGVKHYIVEYDNPKSPIDDLDVQLSYLAEV